MIMEWIMDSPVALIGLLLAICVGLIALMVHSENEEMAAFQQRCLASGETVAKCEILGEVKRSALDANIAAGFAVGMAASKR